MQIMVFTDELGINVTDPNFGEIATNYIQDTFFNGADSAVVYLGTVTHEGALVSAFDLIPG